MYEAKDEWLALSIKMNVTINQINYSISISTFAPISYADNCMIHFIPTEKHDPVIYYLCINQNCFRKSKMIMDLF